MPEEKTRIRLAVDAGGTPRATILVPRIEYDEKLDCFYTGPRFDLPSGYESKELPTDFHTHELADVNPDDTQSLLDFQREWGLVTATTRHPLRVNKLGRPGEIIAQDDSQESFNRAESLMRSLRESHPEDERWAELMALTRLTLYPFASREEVASTVRSLQGVISSLIHATTEGVDGFGGIAGELVGIEERNLMSLVDDIDRAIVPYLPRIQVIPSTAVVGEIAPPNYMPLSCAVLYQFVRCLGSGRGYKVCPNCNHYFTQKRHEIDLHIFRERVSDYCSDTCQERAKAIRQAESRKKSRREKKASNESKEG